MKMDQFRRSFWAGMMATAIIAALVLPPRQVFAQQAAPASDQTVAPLDMETDANHDGKPDALMAAVEQIEALDTLAREQQTPANQAALEAVLARFEQSLPYSKQTRAIQQRILTVRAQMQTQQDTASQKVAAVELRQLTLALYSDPNFATIDRILGERLDERLQAKAQPNAALPAASSATQQVVRPATSQMANATSTVFTPALLNILIAPDPACQNVNRQTNGQANFSVLQRGYMMFFKNDTKLKNFAYARKFTHIGVYDGPNANNVRQVYESNASYSNDPDGGPKLLAMDYWQATKGACVSLAYYNTNMIPLVNVQNALTAKETQYGTNGEIPYPAESLSDITNYWLKKDQDTKITCSLLAWKIYKQAGVDVDSNDIRYRLWFVSHWMWIVTGIPAWVAGNLVVAPDEIYLHPNLTIASEGLDP